MKHIKSYKVFEEAGLKPTRSSLLNLLLAGIYLIFEEAGLNPHELVKGKRSSMQDFSLNIVLRKIVSNMKDSDGWGKGESDSRYNKFIFGVGIVNS
jgi:hypothetical protein